MSTPPARGVARPAPAGSVNPASSPHRVTIVRVQSSTRMQVRRGTQGAIRAPVSGIEPPDAARWPRSVSRASVARPRRSLLMQRPVCSNALTPTAVPGSIGSRASVPGLRRASQQAPRDLRQLAVDRERAKPPDLQPAATASARLITSRYCCGVRPRSHTGPRRESSATTTSRELALVSGGALPDPDARLARTPEGC